VLAIQALAVAVLSQARYLAVLAIRIPACALLSNFLSLVLWSVLTVVLCVVLELLVCSIFPTLPRWELTAENSADLRSHQGASLALLGPADPFLRARSAL